MSAARPLDRGLNAADFLNAVREQAHRYVIRTALKPGHRHTLDVLIECADIHGQICLPMPTIAGAHGGCVRTVQRHLPELDSRTELRVDRRPNEGRPLRHRRGLRGHAPSVIQLERCWTFALSEVGAVVRPVPTPRPRPAAVAVAVKFQKPPTDKMSDSGEISLSVPRSSLQISVTPPIAHAREGAEGTQRRTAPNGAPKESRPSPTLPKGGQKPRRQSFEEAVCIVRAAPGDRKILEEHRARRHLGELRAALAASKLPMDLLVTAAEQYARAEGPWRTWRTLKHGVRSIVSDVPRWTADLAQRAERRKPPPKARAPSRLRAIVAPIGAGASGDNPDSPVSPRSPSAPARSWDEWVVRINGRPPTREAPAQGPIPPRPNPPAHDEQARGPQLSRDELAERARAFIAQLRGDPPKPPDKK